MQRGVSNPCNMLQEENNLKLLNSIRPHTVRVWFSLVILTSHFEATRGLLWDRPRNFEPRSDDEDVNWAGTPSSNFRATPTGGRLASKYNLAWLTWQICSGIWFRTWNPQPQSRDLSTRPPLPHIRLEVR
ncbi:hypothetical protein AVEN_47898-1 [Araneus ventricosus]|uniref:Uncharacterized protein n=1 Tax=Araneus ventricosus TaxID=182803 RepID=A0A4Y2H402_ARAVE|nr:hypothetical protein AVEN_47898-1 [Araneus ventricosus]